MKSYGRYQEMNTEILEPLSQKLRSEKPDSQYDQLSSRSPTSVAN